MEHPKTSRKASADDTVDEDIDLEGGRRVPRKGWLSGSVSTSPLIAKGGRGEGERGREIAIDIQRDKVWSDVFKERGSENISERVDGNVVQGGFPPLDARDSSSSDEAWLEIEIGKTTAVAALDGVLRGSTSSSDSVKSNLSKLSKSSAVSSMTSIGSSTGGHTMGLLRTDNGSVVSKSRSYFSDVMELLRKQREEGERIRAEEEEKEEEEEEEERSRREQDIVSKTR